MASGGGTICLACAEPVKKGNRRILGASNSTEVTVLWKEVISRDIEKRGVNLDLEQLIQEEAYICRSCFNIYDKLLEKQKDILHKYIICIGLMYYLLDDGTPNFSSRDKSCRIC